MNFTGQFLYELEKQKKKKELLESLTKNKPKNTSTSNVAPTAAVTDAKDDFSKDFLKELERFREEKTMKETTRRGLLDNDLAPVRTDIPLSGIEKKKAEEKEKEKDEDEGGLDFFDRGALAGIDFKKGNTHSQVAKALLGTAGDVGLSIVKSVSRLGEGITDLAQYGAAEGLELFGADKTAAKIKKNAQRNEVDEFFGSVKRSKADENFDSVLGWDEKLDKYSLLGETGKSVAEGVGQAGAIVLTGGLGASAGLGTAGTTALTTATMGASGIGSGIGEAYEGGATDAEAWTYGAIAGAADAVTELLSGGMGKAVKAAGLSHGLGGFDDIVAKKLSEKITNTIAKNAVQFGVKATGEGLEEVLAGTVQAVAKWKTYADDEDLLSILKDENLFEQFIVGAMTSGVMQTPGLVNANTSGRDFVTGRTQNEQTVVDRVVEQRVKDAEADGKKLSAKEKQNIEEQAVSDMERGRIDVDTIEEVLAGDEYKAYQDAIKEEDALRKEYEELGKLTNPTLAEKTRFDELHQKSGEFTSDERRNSLKQELDERVSQMAAADRLGESFAERSRRGEYFADDVNKYKSDAAKKTVQNLIDAKIANNTSRTREMAESVAKIAEDRGTVFNFTNNAKLRESGRYSAVKEGVTINGYKDADGITVNLSSPKAWQFIVGHEVTHTLEGSAAYNELAEAVKAYAQTKGEYDSRRASIASLYSDGTDIDSELTSDMVGEYLFTDEQFVQELSTKHQNVFQKIFAEIKHLLKMATAGSKEARQLEQVKHTFEKAYRASQQGQQTQAGTGTAKYSLESYTDHQVENWKNSKRIVIYDGNEQLASFIREAVTDKNMSKKMYFGAVSHELADRIREDTGLNVEKYNLSLGADEIRKILKDHGDVNKESLRGQRAITEDDFAHIVDVVVNPSDVTLSETTYNGKPAIVFTGEHNGRMNVVAVVSDKRLDLFVQTAYVNAKKENLATPTDEQASVNTPEASSGTVFSENSISHLGENVNRQFSLGYHAGDLGKAEFYHQQGGSRGTGHFGTGTYFVGDEQKISGDNTYGKRPHHAVEFDNYNLYKVRNDSDGYQLHDQLRVIDSGFSAEFLQAAKDDKYRMSEMRSEAYDRAEKYDTKTYDEETGLDFSEDYIGANIRAFTEVADENGVEIQSYDEWLSEQSDDVPSQGDGDYDFYKSDYLDYLKEKLQEVDAERNSGYEDFRDAYFNLWLRFGKKNVDAALQAVVDHDAAMMPDGEFDYWSAAEKGADSRATVFMKALGYEGIDARDTALDNVEYGSVIYDLKGADAQKKADIGTAKFSLSDASVSPPVRGTSARDLLYQGEDIAPVQQTAAEVETLDADMFPDDLSMMSEDEGAEYDRLNSFSDEDAPPENVAPYYGDEDAQPMPDDPFETRDIKAVGKRNVESFMSANPEVKPFFQQEANVLLGELERTVKGERFMSADGEWTGTSRHTTDDIAYLLDELKYSYADIRRGLDAIIEGEGAENIAVAKRIEFIINDRLTKGYTDAFSGVEIPPDSEYLNLLREKQVTEYNAASVDALMSDADAYVPPITEDSAPEMENTQAPVTAAAEIDAPMAETAAQVEADTQAAVDEIRTTYDKLLAKKQNAETELATNREQRAAASQRYQERIDELTRKYNGKKNKETKAAINLQRQISRLERLKADIDADYAKRVSDIEQRIARRDFDLQQDHTQADKLERAYAKIDAQMEGERAAVREEFAQRREELSAAVSDKNEFVGRRAMELYRELSNLKKGVRASYELGYLLDRGYDWRTLKSTLLKVNLRPGEVINPDSVMESDIRSMLAEEHKSKTYELAELDGEMQDRLAQLDTEAEKQKAEVRKSEQQLRRSVLHKNLVEGLRGEYATRGYDLDAVLKDAKNLSTFSTVDNTPQRVMEKALGYKEGQILADMTVNRTAQNETEGIRWLNRFTDPKTGVLAQISKQYQIKPGSKESAAAQMYAEGFYVNKYDEIVSYGDRELALDFPDEKVRDNIKKLAHDPRIRQIYDETLDMINESRVRNAYPEIQKLDNYYLHFRAMEDTFSTLGLPFNPNDIRAKDLPTDLSGVTADLKPGQPYFASSMHREGKRTSFDLLGGLEKYLSSAKNQIYHIDDIQTLRALRNYIADDYGQAKGLESLDGLTEEEVQQRIKDVYGSHLSTFAKFLNEQANVIAGKTSLADRGIEGIIGRRGITFLNDLNRQVGANMVGFNVSSSLTNFLAPVQAFAKMNKTAFVRGFAQTVSNRVKGIVGGGDGFAAESPVMVRREGEKRFYRTAWQKLSDPGYVLMGAVDSISTEIIARGKYNELTAKGMSSDQAHYETDKWVSRLMGDRSLGQQPHLYNSKMLGLITKFQLEVRNQLDSQFYDTFQEAKVSTEQIENAKKRNAVKAAKITSTLVTLAVSQHIFGKVFESIAGYNPAFDIIEAIIKAAGWDDEEDDDDTVLDNIEQGFLSLLEDLPYASTFTGGRVPIESALPIEQLVKGKDSYGNDKSRLETLAEAAPYYLLPGGYGQIKKTVQGLSMYSDDHPVAGSYTDSGNLRFPVDDAPLGVAQAAIFGQYSSGNARDYFDNERKPLSEKQINEYAAADMTIQEYWKYRDGLSEHDNLASQADYINSLDIPTWKKNLFINNLTERKEAIDMTEYGQYGSLAEMDFAKKSPEKYKLIQDHGVSYEQYQAFDDDTKGAYSWAAENPEKYSFIQDIGYTIDDYASATDEQKDAWTWAYKNPEKYTVSRAVSDDLFTYREYTGALNDIKADKDADGKSISGSRKEKVIDYINSLDADYGQKIILLKSEYPSEDSYNNDIIDYLNERDDISYEEMAVILTELGFKVSADGTVTWD